MRIKILVVFSIVFCFSVSGQVETTNLLGTVSFLSSQNIYVKFKSTNGLNAGDTLYISSKGDLVPVLKINNLSSTSCVCTSISNINLFVSDQIISRKKSNSVNASFNESKVLVKETPKLKDSVMTNHTQFHNLEQKQIIKGSISAYAFSDFSNTAAPSSTRLRYTLSLEAINFKDSKISFSSYLSFRHKIGAWNEVKSDLFNALKIYDLSVKYDLNKSTHISLGRKINTNISSIGAMDGLQLEKTINRFGAGALIGFRPDFKNYGFDSKLFQYGAYVSYNSLPSETYYQSSIAFMQQMNGSKTDRRFLYLQHTNSLIKNIYFFSTFEADLYKSVNNKIQNTFDLTGLYLSLRYRLTNNLTITGSYDARKNVLYYETYKTLIDSVLINETRKSLRLQVNYRITKNLMLGMNSDYRFFKSDPHPAININGYLTYSQIPGLDVSVTLEGNYLKSAYMNGKIFGAKVTRDLFQGKLEADMGYRYVDYRLPESNTSIPQNIGEFSVYWQLSRKISLSINYEGTFERKDRYNRLYFQIRKRF
jgi:hypothetical protein